MIKKYITKQKSHSTYFLSFINFQFYSQQSLAITLDHCLVYHPLEIYV